MDCLKNIVGVIPEACECTTGTLSPEELAELKKSTSGLYLDNLPGGVALSALNKFDACKDFSKKSLTAITSAIRQTEDDLTVGITSQTGGKVVTFQGEIGQMSYAGLLTGQLKEYQGILLRSSKNSDAVLTLNRIFINVNATVDTTLKIFKANRGTVIGTEIYSFNVTTEANSYKQIDTLIDGVEIKIPLSENGRALDIYFVYARNGSTPKDNKLGCNCSMQQVEVLNSFVTPVGVQMDANNVYESVQNDTYGHGLTLDVTLKCNSAQLFCRGFNSSEGVSLAMAYAVWYKAGELLIEDVLKSPDVNRYTTMSREYLYGKRNHFRAQYDGRINWLTGDDGIKVNDSNCFVCGDESFIKAGIIATQNYSNVRESIDEYRTILSETQEGSPFIGNPPAGYTK